MPLNPREESIEGQLANSNTMLSEARQVQNAPIENNGNENLIEYCLENRAMVVLNNVNNMQINELANNLNNQLDINTVPAPNNIEMVDIEDPNETIIDTGTVVIKTEPHNESPLPYASILFSQTKRIKTGGNVAMFHRKKSAQDNNASLRVLYEGSYIEIDESKCLEWLQNNARHLVEFCAIPNEFARPSRSRRSGRIARMGNVNYCLTPRKRQKRI